MAVRVRIIIVVSVTFSLVTCSPVCQGGCDKLAILTPETTETDADTEFNNKDGNNPRPCSHEEEGTVKCLQESTKEDQSEERVVILESEPDNPYFAEEPVPYNSGSSFAYMQPTILPSAAYQGSPLGSLAQMGIGMGNYRGVIYPHVHPKLFAALNPRYPAVRSLPPVHATYIHGLIPEQSYVPKPNFDLDVYHPQNTVLLPTLVRPSRMLRSTEEEFLAELSHDAIMNNIIPTMQVPFSRYASAPTPTQYSYGASGGSPAIAVFPDSASGGCAQPILFSCSPQITRGYMRPGLENVPLPAPAIAYRQQAEPTSKIVGAKDITHVKLGLPDPAAKPTARFAH